jgi:hypothetical protein
VTAHVNSFEAHLKVMEMEHKRIYDVKETHTRTVATKNEGKTLFCFEFQCGLCLDYL